MAPRSNFIKVQHGKMELNIPIKLFEPGTYDIRPAEAEKLRKILMAQYPWLTDNAIDVILRKSQEEMAMLMDAERTVADRAREMIVRGDLQKALDFLDAHLFVFEDDIDASYLRAEALMKLGRKDEGFKAMRHAQTLAEKKGKLRTR